MHTTFVIWDNNLNSDGLYLLKRERSPKLCLLKNKSSDVPQPVVFPEAWLPLWPRSLYWLTVKRGCVIQFYLSKSPILSGQKHYFSIRIVFIYDKRPFSSHSWAGVPPSWGRSYSFQSSNIWRFILKTGIHCQKESCLNSAENESWPGGWNSSGVTHGDGVGGAWPPPHQPPISGFHIFGNYM